MARPSDPKVLRESLQVLSEILPKEPVTPFLRHLWVCLWAARERLIELESTDQPITMNIEIRQHEPPTTEETAES